MAISVHLNWKPTEIDRLPVHLPGGFVRSGGGSMKRRLHLPIGDIKGTLYLGLHKRKCFKTKCVAHAAESQYVVYLLLLR